MCLLNLDIRVFVSEVLFVLLGERYSLYVCDDIVAVRLWI